MDSIESILKPDKGEVEVFRSGPVSTGERGQVGDRQRQLLGEGSVEARTGKLVLVVGAGTGGMPVLLNCAEKGYDVAACDYDEVSYSNLGHQGFEEEDVGKNKAIRGARKAAGSSSREIKAVGIPMSFEEAVASGVKWTEEADVAIVFTDNFASRFEVSRHYYGDIPVLVAGIEESNTLAWLFVQRPTGPCLRCRFPDREIDSPDPTSCSGMSLDPARALSGYISFAIDSLFMDHEYRRINWNWLQISLDGFVTGEMLQVEKNQGCKFCSEETA